MRPVRRSVKHAIQELLRNLPSRPTAESTESAFASTCSAMAAWARSRRHPPDGRRRLERRDRNGQAACVHAAETADGADDRHDRVRDTDRRRPHLHDRLQAIGQRAHERQLLAGRVHQRSDTVALAGHGPVNVAVPKSQ